MDKQNLVNPYRGIVFSPKKERSTDTCHNTTLGILCYIKQVRYKRLHSIGFHLCEMSRVSKSVGIGSRSVVARGWRMVEKRNISYTYANQLCPCLPHLALGKYPKGKDFNSVFRLALQIILYGLKG